MHRRTTEWRDPLSGQAVAALVQPANTSLLDSEVSAAKATLRQPAVVHALIAAAASLAREPSGARAPPQAMLDRERILWWPGWPAVLVQFRGASLAMQSCAASSHALALPPSSPRNVT